MPSQVRETRRPSNGAISTRTDRRGSVKGTKRASEERRGSIKTQDSDRQRRVSRTNSDANLTNLQKEDVRSGGRDAVQPDLYDRPLRSPRRRSSRSSRTNVISYGSYGARALDSDVTYDVNVVVLGNEAVGKTTFIHRTLDLDAKDALDPPSRILTIAGNLCLVRMFELDIGAVYQGENDALCWPERLKHTTIHGVMTLYDVGNKASFKLVPEVLNCVNMMGLPSVLAACKCDINDQQRQLEPRTIEQRATSAFERITTLQTSEASNEPFRRAISAILKNVVNQSQDGLDGAGPRRRTLPQLPGPGPISPRRPPPPGHSRSTSEVPGYRRNEVPSPHYELARNGSSSASKSTSISSRREDLSSSYLMDESHTEDSASHTSVSAQETDASEAEPDTQGTPQTPSEETGWTFDSLVNRLLALPTSKADSKFAAVFLALYRKFAPPGQLLEGIVVRFESIEHTEQVILTRTVAQLRYLTVIEQWMHRYPGDFAHPKTLRRIRTFITKLQKSKIFATAAQEMNNHLEFVTEDDDTEWACCDKERQKLKVAEPGPQYSYRGSLLIDDPNFDFPDDLGSLSLSPQGQRKESTAISDGGSSITSSTRLRSLQFEDIAQREACKLIPQSRTALTKNLWRHFISIPHELVAKEMTRMDWIMFSSIRPRDLVRHVSLSPAQKANCKSLANVSRMIDHFNYVRDWVINFILYRDKPKHRAMMLEKFMQVARKLRELNNYNSLGAVLAGIKSTPVYRLTQTKEMVGESTMRDWMKLEILMAQTRSFSSYRLAWDNSNGERIPYLPLPIRDLVGAESGNKTFLGDEAGGRINWRKFEVMGDVLVSVQRAQGLPYRSQLLGQRNDEVQKMVLWTKIVRDDDVSTPVARTRTRTRIEDEETYGNGKTDDRQALYDRSVQLEATGSNSDRRGFKDFFKR
ncbi:hypothetical protein CAC42_4706 [Sphaceloma murrayae]|uniref:Uncharacterized protein n=1 Tax=Sphaceloma murrayae TaxID=2082308 RepID=A0A2K1QNZ9_9PEZI|nr:hypothetical protein CAC42_4706 [Sphaceloma murrayae]